MAEVMKLYLISQDENDGWDTYDSAVVVAENEVDARSIHPSEYVTHIKNGEWMGTYSMNYHRNPGGEYTISAGDWLPISRVGSVNVKYLGETNLNRGVVLASFNAG